MLIEQAALASRWRPVAPQAKLSLALAGLIAAHAAPGPQGALLLAGVLVLLACRGGGVPLRLYARVASAPLVFLLLSSLSFLVALGPDGHWHWAPDALPQLAGVLGRSLAGLAALLGLVMTTPFADVIACLRRLRCPAVLLDMMVLGYRMLFILSQAVGDTLAAQQARLGYASFRHSWRSLGMLTGGLAVQVWQRARALQLAAQARNGEAGLRFLTPRYAHAGRDTALAVAVGALLIALVLGVGR